MKGEKGVGKRVFALGNPCARRGGLQEKRSPLDPQVPGYRGVGPRVPALEDSNPLRTMIENPLEELSELASLPAEPAGGRRRPSPIELTIPGLLRQEACNAASR
jgi:hypothetical protein